jgi:hypothetical protein
MKSGGANFGRRGKRGQLGIMLHQQPNPHEFCISSAKWKRNLLVPSLFTIQSGCITVRQPHYPGTGFLLDWDRDALPPSVIIHRSTTSHGVIR